MSYPARAEGLGKYDKWMVFETRGKQSSWRMSLMSSSLLLQQCPSCLVCLIWIVCVMGSRLPYSCKFVGCCFRDLFKTTRSILQVFFSLIVLLESMWCIHTIVLILLQLGRNPILFYTIDNLSIVVYVFARAWFWHQFL